MRLRIILENKLLLISINFTPKTSHSCLKKLYTRFSRISFIPPPRKKWTNGTKKKRRIIFQPIILQGYMLLSVWGGGGEYQEYHLQFLCLSSTLHVLSCWGTCEPLQFLSYPQYQDHAAQWMPQIDVKKIRDHEWGFKPSYIFEWYGCFQKLGYSQIIPCLLEFSIIFTIHFGDIHIFSGTLGLANLRKQALPVHPETRIWSKPKHLHLDVPGS